MSSTIWLDPEVARHCGERLRSAPTGRGVVQRPQAGAGPDIDAALRRLMSILAEFDGLVDRSCIEHANRLVSLADETVQVDRW